MVVKAAVVHLDEGAPLGHHKKPGDVNVLLFGPFQDHQVNQLDALQHGLSAPAVQEQSRACGAAQRQVE